jgi:beta-glucosidase
VTADPSPTPAAVDAVDMADLVFPPGFRFGAATSAHQVEGDTHANTWTRWEVRGRPDGSQAVSTGERCGLAVDHWRRFETDLQIMVELGLGFYRFSVEWSRVEPVEGYVDTAALDRYRHWCRLLRTAGIEPVVTLHHFTEPTWFADRGGFEAPDAMAPWTRFVETVVAALGEFVDLWITVNEPTGYAVQGWWWGAWPPGATDFPRAARVVAAMLTAHARAADVIRRVDTYDADGDGRPCRVAFAHHVVPFRPRRRWSPIDRLGARAIHDAYNVSVLRALRTGRFRLTVPGLGGVDVVDRRWCDTLDWLGVNAYYSLPIGLSSLRPPFLGAEFTGGGPANDLGWDLDATVLSDACRFAAGWGLPILVTEHGACDGEQPDRRRRRFLAESLAHLRIAVREGVPVEGYLHWSLLDNFEWAEGFAPRFGLIRVDRATQERTWTSSAVLYRDIIRQNTGRSAADRA